MTVLPPSRPDLRLERAKLISSFLAAFIALGIVIKATADGDFLRVSCGVFVIFVSSALAEEACRSFKE